MGDVKCVYVSAASAKCPTFSALYRACFSERSIR